jgi:hypothetical protein
MLRAKVVPHPAAELAQKAQAQKDNDAKHGRPMGLGLEARAPPRAPAQGQRSILLSPAARPRADHLELNDLRAAAQVGCCACTHKRPTNHAEAPAMSQLWAPFQRRQGPKPTDKLARVTWLMAITEQPRQRVVNRLLETPIPACFC